MGRQIRMRIHLALPVIILSALFSGTAHGQYSGVDGCNPGPCPNATPCRHCTGSWTDNVGYRWAITTNLVTWVVTGTVSVANPVTGCPAFVFQVVGSITPTGGTYPFTPGSTKLYLHATSPSPAECGGVIAQNGTVNVNIRNDGCDIAAGTAQNDDGSWYDPAYAMAKFPDLPAGESTKPVGWYSVYPTIQQFRQTLAGQSGPFDGRQVAESAGSDQNDGCYYSGAAAKGYAKFGVTGGWWIVGRYATPPLYFYSNYWIDDYVGMTPTVVSFYQQNRAPCDAYAQQIMNICTNGQGCPYVRQYYQDYISYSVNKNSVVVGRNGQYASRPWP